MAGSTQPYHDPSFLREVWGFFALGMVVFIARFSVRLRKAGIRRFQGDDYMAVAVLVFYIIDAVTVTIIYHVGSNVDFTQAQIDAFDDEQIRKIVYGSKMELLAWYTYTGMIWGLKACLLFFYNRLTFGLTQQLFVKGLAVLCVSTYVAMFLTITLSCRPFKSNYQVRPLPPASCTLRKQNFILCTVLNTMTDGMILSIPIPLLFKLRIPLKKKIPIGTLLCSGIFVISAAIIRIEMTLKSHPSALTINRWGIRETNIALIAVTAPILRPIFSRHFWTGKTSRQSSRRSHGPMPPQNSGSGDISDGKSSGTLSKFTSILRRTDTAMEMSEMTKKSGTTTTMKTDVTTTQHLEGDGEIAKGVSFSSQDGIVTRPSRILERMSEDEIERLAHPGVHVESIFKRRFEDVSEDEETPTPSLPDPVLASRRDRRFGRMVSMPSGPRRSHRLTP